MRRFQFAYSYTHNGKERVLDEVTLGADEPTDSTQKGIQSLYNMSYDPDGFFGTVHAQDEDEAIHLVDRYAQSFLK